MSLELGGFPAHSCMLAAARRHLCEEGFPRTVSVAETTTSVGQLIRVQAPLV